MISRIARSGLAWMVAMALAVAALAGCGSTISGTAEPAPGVGGPTTTAPTSAGPTTPFDGTKTAPGTKLKIGEAAVVDVKGSKGIGVVKITPTAIERGAISDLSNFKMNDEDKGKTPFYLRLTIEYMGGADLSFAGIDANIDGLDDRGQETGEVVLIGTFDKCDSNNPPRGWTTGQPFQSCKTFLLGGTGELTGARYSESGTPYRDGPVTWTK